MEETKPCLYVIGLGVKIPGHTTIEASDAMARCRRIYSIVQEPPRIWLPRSNLAIPVINLINMYVEGAFRMENYERVADTILAALKEKMTVGYVTYGNPLAYDSVGQKLVRDSRDRGIQCEVITGISSIDTLLCDLGLDMAPGVQIYEASWMVTYQAPLNLTVPAILLQMREFGSFRTHYRERRPATNLADLVGYLTQFYPATHPGFLVQSSNQTQPAVIKKVALGELITLAPSDFLPSMYIPALNAPQADPQIVTKMQQS